MGERTFNPRAMEHRVWEAISREKMIFSGEKVLCAVSGGADSMALLHLLHRLSERFGFALEAASFDHCIRPEGAEDVRFVERRCAAWGVPCHLGRSDVPAAAREAGTGLEETARKLRYAFLEETADAVGAQRIATAHNADDNAETLLLHLLRGSGLKGLGGIAPVRGRVIRPLLGVSRAEIEAYCASCGISFVTDDTNADTAYTRNYLRHEVLPLLRSKNPRLLTTLNRTARSLRRDSACLEAEAERLFQSARRGPDRVGLGAEALLALPEALSLRLVQRMAEALLPGCVLSAVQRERVLELCRSERPSAACVLTGALTARREYGEIVLTVEPERREEEQIALQCGEWVRFHGRLLSCEQALCPEGKFNQPHCFYLRPGGVLLLRAPRPGEHITLPNRPRKAVKTLLSEAKLPLHQRGMAIALEEEGVLCALDGFGADLRYLPKPGELCWNITSSPVEETTIHPIEKETDYGTGKGH